MRVLRKFQCLGSRDDISDTMILMPRIKIGADNMLGEIARDILKANEYTLKERLLHTGDRD
jgi:hypothetical protein